MKGAITMTIDYEQMQREHEARLNELDRRTTKLYDDINASFEDAITSYMNGEGLEKLKAHIEYMKSLNA